MGGSKWGNEWITATDVFVYLHYYLVLDLLKENQVMTQTKSITNAVARCFKCEVVEHSFRHLNQLFKMQKLCLTTPHIWRCLVIALIYSFDHISINNFCLLQIENIQLTVKGKIKMLRWRFTSIMIILIALLQFKRHNLLIHEYVFFPVLS